MRTVCDTVLHVDLSTLEVKTEILPKDLLEAYVGGRGVGAFLLWQHCTQGIDPLAAQNPLIISTGALNGTCAPMASRWTVTSKSPATGGYLKSSGGGHFATQLRFAGYDYIVITGRAETPVYVYIRDGNVSIRDAQHLWGLDTRQADRVLKEELGDENVVITQIGPAGENGVRFAGIMTSIYRTAARGGTGAVMGAKNLKAIVVRGTGELGVADAAAFERAAFGARLALRDDEFCWRRSFLYGTAQGVIGANLIRRFPHRNFQDGYMADAFRLSGEYIAEHYLEHRKGCSSCVFHCGRFTRVRSGKYAGTYAGGPEYETVSALGARCDVSDTAAVIKANEMVNILGLDSISTGAAISFAMECFERGLLSAKDTGGLDLSWGNSEAMLALILQIARREGLGTILADGVGAAARAIGHGAEEWAVQSKGLEQSEVDVRSRFSYALAFAVNPRGPDHLMSEVLLEAGYTPEVARLAQEIAGSKAGTNPQTTEGKARLVTWSEDLYCASDALGICAFATTWSYNRVGFANMAQMFEAMTGIPMDATTLREAMQRVINLERLFNIREGFRKQDDTLHKRMFEQPQGDPPAGLLLTREDLAKMVDEYYSLRSWDRATGIPTRDELDRLDLDWAGRKAIGP